MDSNLKYADTVFRKYFSCPHRLIEIYNSVNDTHLPEDTPIDIVHMPDNILCKDRINDVAFVINDEIIVLLEQQSPVDENTPLRMLLYISRLYEKYIESVDHGAIYKKKSIKLPTPKFYVLYTGKDEDFKISSDWVFDAFHANNRIFGMPKRLEYPLLIHRSQCTSGAALYRMYLSAKLDAD